MSPCSSLRPVRKQYLRNVNMTLSSSPNETSKAIGILRLRIDARCKEVAHSLHLAGATRVKKLLNSAGLSMWLLR